MSEPILLTGFRAFGPHAENPSEAVVRRIGAAPPGGIELATEILPVEYGHAFDAVRAALDARPLRAALLVGLAANRASLEFERFALNWRGAAMADEAGVVVDGLPVDPSGPAAYLATLPVDDLVETVRAAGLPCQPSSHAGTYLCNQVLYQTLRHTDVHGLSCRAVFLHLPEPGPPAAGRPDLDALTRGVEAALVRIDALTRKARVATAPRRPRTPPRTRR